jgi:replicative DNA helicase
MQDTTNSPFSTDAEMYLLGCIIMEPEYAEDVAKFINGSDFANTKHQVIYDAVQAITKDTKKQSGTPNCDPVQLVAYLETKGTYALCGGPKYIESLIECRCTGGTVQHHARRIRDFAQLRRIAEMNERITHQIRTGTFATTSDTEAFLRRASKSYQRACAPMPDPNLILESGNSLVVDRINKIKSGEINTVKTPWLQIDKYIQPFLPGSVVVLSGAPGSSKSFFALELISYMLENGTDADLLALESGRQYHLTRRLAQVSGESRLTSIDWVSKNADTAMNLQAQYADRLELLGQHLYEAEEITYRHVTEWVIGRMKAGARLVCIDPITLATKEGKVWEADQSIMLELIQAAKEYKASVLIVTHPPKPNASHRNGPPDQGDMAGGAAFSRFSTSSFILVRLKTPRKVICHDNHKHVATHFLYIGKARDGSGSGMFAMIFDQQSLTFKLGVLVKEDKGDFVEEQNESNESEDLSKW